MGLEIGIYRSIAQSVSPGRQTLHRLSCAGSVLRRKTILSVFFLYFLSIFLVNSFVNISILLIQFEIFITFSS